jgi:hypothetical protein
MLRMKRAEPHLTKNDDGAVVVLVAIFMVVLVGLGSLVVDVGGLYWEKRQLQNAADAGALALAAQCAEGEVDCGSTPAALATSIQMFVDGNANDQRTGLPVEVAHGADPHACAPGSMAAANPQTGPNVVKVSTSTVDANNNEAGFLTHAFASIFGIDTTTVFACATAQWGYAATLATMPLVISTCDFYVDPDDPNPLTQTFAGPHPNPAASSETIMFHQGTGGGQDGCTAQAGQDANNDGFLPAGFGWLENDGSCVVVTTVVDGDEWVHKDPGANPECGSAELQGLLGTVIQLPVFNDFCRPHPSRPECPSYNNKDKYRVHTYASFYLQGYKLGGGPAMEGGVQGCSGSQRCIVGYFTTSTVASGDFGGPPGGVMVVRLTG